jgi:hypothetical protein
MKASYETPEVVNTVLPRGSNRAGRVGFGSDGSGQFDFLKEIKSDRVGSGLESDRINLYIVFFQIFDKFRLN